jgi:hypothetical protein
LRRREADAAVGPCDHNGLAVDLHHVPRFLEVTLRDSSISERYSIVMF